MYGKEDLEIWMDEAKTILVTGGKGLVGSALKAISGEYGYNFFFTDRSTHDLTREDDVRRLFEESRPDYVIHTAARVGGIGRNLSSPAQQFYDNILMNTYVIDQSSRHDVKKLIAFSSVCAFPASAKLFSEDILHDGAPYPAHGSYAYSKRMVDVQIEAYNSQYGLNYCSVIPANIFGENDNFNLEDGHVVPSLIHKCFVAKKQNTTLDVWGDGSPMREFLYSKDVARVCLGLLEKNILPQRIIVSGNQELTIKTLVDMICNLFDYHNVSWSPEKPNGQQRRPSDKSVFNEFFPNHSFTGIEDALGETIMWLKKKLPED